MSTPRSMFRILFKAAMILNIFLFFFACQTGMAAEAGIDLTDKEKECIGRFLSKGKITIATRISDHVYFPTDHGVIKGLYYNMAKNFADFFELQLDVRTVKWSDYFSKDGEFPNQVRTDADFTYTPDLIKEVDIYVDAFTIYPWREKILKMIKFFPTKTVAITRQGEELSNVSDLKGKILAVHPQSTYSDTFREIEKILNTKFNYLKINSFLEGLEAVSTKRADVACMDSHDAWITRYENLNMSIPLTVIQYICWIVEKDNDTLASIIRKFFYYSMETGRFDKYWFENYNIEFSMYLKMIYLKDLK